jgi:hypothetical protein
MTTVRSFSSAKGRIQISNHLVSYVELENVEQIASHRRNGDTLLSEISMNIPRS